MKKTKKLKKKNNKWHAPWILNENEYRENQETVDLQQATYSYRRKYSIRKYKTRNLIISFICEARSQEKPDVWWTWEVGQHKQNKHSTNKRTSSR